MLRINVREKMSMKNLSRVGTYLLTESNIVEAHSTFIHSIQDVGDWLNKEYPGSGLSAEWASLGNSRLIVGNITDISDPQRWFQFHSTVEK
jgi:hypothetical protein